MPINMQAKKEMKKIEDISDEAKTNNTVCTLIWLSKRLQF